MNDPQHAANILAECLREAGDDHEAGFAAAEYILSQEPMALSPMAYEEPRTAPPNVWTKDDYPRDNAGRFLVKYDIVDAANNPTVLIKFRESIPEGQKHKLDRAVNILQSGGTIHHPEEPPELGVDARGRIPDFRWEMYSHDLNYYDAWSERQEDRKTCKGILGYAVRNLRSKTTQDLDHIDELLADANIDDRSKRDLARLRHKRDADRVTKEELEDLYEEVIEKIYQQIEAESSEDPEPPEPRRPSPTSAMLSIEEWVSDPGPRARNRWRNTKTGRVEYGSRPGGRGGGPNPRSKAKPASLPPTTLPRPGTGMNQVPPSRRSAQPIRPSARVASQPPIQGTIPHQQNFPQPPAQPQAQSQPQATIPPEDISSPRGMVSPPPAGAPRMTFTPRPSLRQHGSEESGSPNSEIVSKLESAPVSSSERLDGGANGSYKVVIDGMTAVWKPSDEERFLRFSVEAGTYYKREAAAYSIAAVIGLDHLVPITVEKSHGGKIGSIQHWVDDADTAIKFEGGSEFDGEDDLKLSAAFDYLIGNTDRHMGNWMLDYGEGKLHLIDNGLGFPANLAFSAADETMGTDRFRSYLFDKCAKSNLEIPDVVSSWDEARISEELKAHNIEEEAIAGVVNRLSKLKEALSNGTTFSQLIPPSISAPRRESSQSLINPGPSETAP